ncbi:MAG: VCBS repeat-containing protein, partial [Flavobacteriaceae bacterium]|nr:VCBS repeat-containing protein [Flavobacteriaceae bacterium]
MYKSKFSFIILFLLLGLLSCKSDKQSDSEDTSGDQSIETPTSSYSNFIKISAEDSQLIFENTITHDLATKFNLFDYDYFYNGSGVGIEDINNDGLMDIFFCGNQVENKLFLNKGNLVFEDITTTANINTNKFWSSGVTFVDINSDGWADIYISQGGPYDKDNRKNLLFINQKDNSFVESAEDYGLDDHGISTQSAFFDFDKDGDLDCVVMNENSYYGTDPATFYRILSDKALLQENSSHLYLNTNGKFKDISEQAGILRPSFGLGLCISDLNNDNWLDIYIANDYYVPDAMYINTKNGTFTDQIKTSTNQVSFYGMGLDIADLNNDNHMDIFVLDMASSDHVRSKTLMASMNVPRFNLLIDDLGLQYQYMFNSVQVNMGDNKYTNLAQFSGMSKTDWSWAALVLDTDHDTFEDVYVTNGYRRYALDNDSRIRVAQAKQQYRGNVPLSVKEQIYNELPSEKLPNILYKNKGDLKFENVTALSELNEPSFSNGAAYSDLDNDGDLDMVVNNMDHPSFLFKNMTVENNGGNYLKVITKGDLSEDFAKVSISFNGITKTKESKRVRGYISAVDKTIHFGLGKADKIETLKVIWPSGKSQVLSDIQANTVVTLNESNAQDPIGTEILDSWLQKVNALDFTHIENDFNDFNKEVLLPYKQSTLGPSITRGDVNGDSKDDIFIGGALGQAAQLFIQTDSGFNRQSVAAFETDRNFEDMEAVFFDIDNDNDNDLYVISGGSEFNERSNQLRDRLYLNNGQGNFSKAENSELDVYTISGKTVSKIDFDKDGDTDIIVGNRIKPQRYPLHEPSIVYENDNGILKNVTGAIAPEFEDFGMVNKVITTDFNNDGWPD